MRYLWRRVSAREVLRRLERRVEPRKEEREENWGDEEITCGIVSGYIVR